MSKHYFNINGVRVTFTTKMTYIPNPKQPRGKAYARYEGYKTAKTFQEYFEVADPKYAHADLRWDHAHGFVKFDTDDTNDYDDVRADYSGDGDFIEGEFTVIEDDCDVALLEFKPKAKRATKRATKRKA